MFSDDTKLNKMKTKFCTANTGKQIPRIIQVDNMQRFDSGLESVGCAGSSNIFAYIQQGDMYMTSMKHNTHSSRSAALG